MLSIQASYRPVGEDKMSVTYHMAKAYQELLLRDSEGPLLEETLHPRAGPATHPALTTVVNLLAAPLLLFRRTVDADTAV
jgi:hypothetical protein